MNAYVHIPFCSSICSYCDFTSFAGGEPKIPAFVKALSREIAASSLEGPLETVYFGGGTPSLLGPGEVEAILGAFRAKIGIAGAAEVSLEANPETVDGKKLRGFRASGVNRLSMGAQASQKEILKRLGRGHEWEKVEEVFGAARQAGFDNLNLDLMFGLPGQTFDMFRESLQKAAALEPDHLSLYALQVEEGTPLAKLVSEGLKLPPEDMVADEYSFAQEFLSAKGFGQYEVSNFSRPGKECRHNLNIWRGEDYWGFGVGAVGTVKGIRHSHGEDLGEYLRTEGAMVLQTEVIPSETLAWERLMLGLRTREGVLKSDLDSHARNRKLSYAAKFDQFQKDGFLLFEEGRFRVAPKGYFVLNGLLEALMV